MLLRAGADGPQGLSALAFFVRSVRGPSSGDPDDLEGEMGLLDKLLGRGKKAAGDVVGDSSLRQEGAAQERAGAAEDRAAQHEELAQEQRNQAAQARTEQEQS